MDLLTHRVTYDEYRRAFGTAAGSGSAASSPERGCLPAASAGRLRRPGAELLLEEAHLVKPEALGGGSALNRQEMCHLDGPAR